MSTVANGVIVIQIKKYLRLIRPSQQMIKCFNARNQCNGHWRISLMAESNPPNMPGPVQLAILQDFEFSMTLGSGAFGKVCLVCEHR